MRRTWHRTVAILGSRYAALLTMLLATLIIYSFQGSYPRIVWVFDLSVLALVASALRAMTGRRAVFYIVLVLGIGLAVLGGLSRSFGLTGVAPYATAVRMVFLGLIIVFLFADVMTRKQVTMDAVLGACCVYLLMGLVWESVYTWLVWLNPDAFVSASGAILPVSGVNLRHETELLYFSLVTMTTIGYGDITPRSQPARIAAAVEGLLAQLYLAIIIARLVAMELADRQRGSSSSR